MMFCQVCPVTWATKCYRPERVFKLHVMNIHVFMMRAPRIMSGPDLAGNKLKDRHFAVSNTPNVKKAEKQPGCFTQ